MGGRVRPAHLLPLGGSCPRPASCFPQPSTPALSHRGRPQAAEAPLLLSCPLPTSSVVCVVPWSRLLEFPWLKQGSQR